jgi:hypothetical protein
MNLKEQLAEIVHRAAEEYLRQRGIKSLRLNGWSLELSHNMPLDEVKVSGFFQNVGYSGFVFEDHEFPLSLGFE